MKLHSLQSMETTKDEENKKLDILPNRKDLFNR